MTKNPFDQFSKQFLEEFLSPFGVVHTNFEVLGEPQYVDVYFEPGDRAGIAAQEIGLLGRFARTPCLFEAFRNQPTSFEIRDCLRKLYQVHGVYQRKSRREDESLQEDDLPFLWILASSASEHLLEGFGAYSSQDWGAGVYLLHRSSRAAIVALNQVPITEATLLLRILGKGKTQKRAVDEVVGFDREDPKRAAILKMLANWKISAEVAGPVEAEEELMMVLTQAYLEWEQQTEQRARTEGEQSGAVREARSLILRLLTRRVGSLTPENRLQVESLTLDQLESLGEALLDFSGGADLERWLRSQC
jgi:Domain of unknown function (DUF4351)